MSETNDDSLNFDLGNDDPAILNEDELLLSDDENGIKLDQPDEDFLLEETDDWVTKELASKESEPAPVAAAPAAEDVVGKHDDSPAIQSAPPSSSSNSSGSRTLGLANESQNECGESDSATHEAVGCEKSACAPVNDAEPHIDTSRPREHSGGSADQSKPRSEVSVETTSPTTTENGAAREPHPVHDFVASESKESLRSTSSSALDDGSTVASSVEYSSSAQTLAETTSTMSSSSSARQSEKTTASEQCDTTSSEEVLYLYSNPNEEHDGAYDTDEISEKRGWKNETKNDTRHPPMHGLHHQQQPQHHGGPPGLAGNRPRLPGMKHPLLPPQQLMQHSGMVAPNILGPHRPNNFGPMHPGARMDFRPGGNRQRYPLRPGFGPDMMNQFRGGMGRMNFPPGPLPPGMHPGVLMQGGGPPGSGGPPMPPMRGFPGRGHPYEMVRHMPPRLIRPMGNANGPQMFRSVGPPNGGPTGPVKGPFGPPVSQSGQQGGQIGNPGGAGAAGAAVAPLQPQSLLSGTFDPMTVGGGSGAGGAGGVATSTNSIQPSPAPAAAPVVAGFPQKVLINPNFKGGVEAVKRTSR